MYAFVLTVLLSVLAPLDAQASGDVSASEVRRLEATGKILPLQTILSKARETKAGRVIDIELESKSGLWIYELELIEDSGRVWEMKINASSGALIKLKEDD
ncbi:MAG: PepSY domain-containing protein [Limnobacter sp.]|nr:PepSY domain-containing protein [Limnobacter sp.]